MLPSLEAASGELIELQLQPMQILIRQDISSDDKSVLILGSE